MIVTENIIFVVIFGAFIGFKFRNFSRAIGHTIIKASQAIPNRTIFLPFTRVILAASFD